MVLSPIKKQTNTRLWSKESFCPILKGCQLIVLQFSVVCWPCKFHNTHFRNMCFKCGTRKQCVSSWTCKTDQILSLLDCQRQGIIVIEFQTCNPIHLLRCERKLCDVGIQVTKMEIYLSRLMCLIFGLWAQCQMFIAVIIIKLDVFTYSLLLMCMHSIYYFISLLYCLWVIPAVLEKGMV